MKINKKLLIAAIIFPSICVCEPLSLNQLIDTAIKNNTDIKISKNKLKIREFEKKEAIGKFLPSINLEYSKIHQSDIPEMKLTLPGLPLQQFPLIEKNYYSIKATLTQPLFTGGYLYYNLKVKDSRKRAETFLVKYKITDIKRKIKQDYYTLTEAKTAVEIAKSYVAAAKNHLKDAENFYKEGIVPRRDLLEAKVKYHETLESLSKAESFYTISLEKLKTDTGTNEIEVKFKKLSYKPLKLNRKQLIEMAYKGNFLLKASEIGAKGAKYGTKIAYSQFLPKVTLALGYEKTDQYPGIGNFDETYGALMVNIPIFEGSQRYWRTLKAKETEREMKLKTTDIKQRLKLGIITSLSKLKSAENRINTAKTMTEQARELLRDSEERYKAQVGTSTEVCDAMAYLTKAKGTLNSAIADYYRALADIEYYVGKLPSDNTYQK